MKAFRFAALAVAITVAGAAAPRPTFATGSHNEPETVMVTFRPKPGAENDLAKVIANHWATARRLDLVLPNPHITLRASDEAGRAYFVDIFTWRSAEIPDHAPAEILAIWQEMNRLTEPRQGKAGLDIVHSHVVTP